MAGGVLRGAGKQLIGALCNLVGFYVIGVPIGVSLMFAANMGVVGKTLLLFYPGFIESRLKINKALKPIRHLWNRTLDRTHCVCANAVQFLPRIPVQTQLEGGS